MLWELTIDNIAVISHSEINFTRGFNVFTGETGAGKSILLGAIGAVLGDRTSRELIRTGESKASVSALFGNFSSHTMEALKECGVDLDEEEELLITREITAEHNSCRINGKPATVAMLRKVGQALVNVHGQQDNQMLTNVDNHRKFVDSYGSIGTMLTEYQSYYTRLSTLSGNIARLSEDETQKAQKIDLLRYQIDEIQSSDLILGEEETLVSRRRMIRNSESLATQLGFCHENLHGGDDYNGVISVLDAVADSLAESSSLIESLEDIAEKVKDFKYELEDVLETVRDELLRLEYDPKELDDIEDRLDTINRLKRKYGPTIEAILKHLQKAVIELEEIEHSDETLTKLQAEYGAVLLNVQKSAKKMTLQRNKSAEKFVKAVLSELITLDMPAVRFEVSITKTELSKIGEDLVEFLLSVNPGESPRPLSKIASGGEMSRIMLAIKSVIATGEDIGTLIFDEVDTGVSGRAAQKVGAKLLSTSNGRQIICVTHLAQVAAFADHHLLIEKQIVNNRTFTQVRALSEGERCAEIARITSGEPITELALKGAAELILFSRKDV